MYHYSGHTRFQWFFETPNQCGAVLAMSAVCAAGLALYGLRKFSENRGSRGKRFLYGVFAVSGFVASLASQYFLAATYSRGGYAAFVVGIALLFFLIRERRVLVFPLFFAACLLLVPDSARRGAELANFADASIGNRLELWKGALAMSADYWKSGVGFGYGGPFLDIYSAWYQPLWMNTFYNTAVDDYLTLSAKGGIFILFAYLAAVFSVVFSGACLCRRNRNAFLAGMVSAQCAYLFGGIFSTFFNVGEVLYPFLALQCATAGWVLFDMLGNRNVVWLKRVYIPLIAATIVCMSILAAGAFFRSGMAVVFERNSTLGFDIYTVSPRGSGARGVILYLFDSGSRSVEQEARLTLRPLAEKGFIVISPALSLRCLRAYALAKYMCRFLFCWQESMSSQNG